MDEISNTQKEGMASEPSVASYNVSHQVAEHLRYKGMETLMKIDDVPSLKILIPQIQKIYLYTINSDRQNVNKERLTNAINIIREYKDNRDEEDSPAILPSVIAFVSNVIRQSQDYILEHWSLFPSNNGTLKLEIHRPDINAGINFGKDESSYYIHIGSDEDYGKCSNTIKHIQNILLRVYYGE